MKLHYETNNASLLITNMVMRDLLIKNYQYCSGISHNKDKFNECNETQLPTLQTQ